MPDYAKARANMVDCQIHTNGVVNPKILSAFETIPRELFAPAHLRNVSYQDHAIAVGEGRFILEPQVHARMLEVCNISDADDSALVIGDESGYAAAIMSFLVPTVLGVSENKKSGEALSKALSAADVCNFVSVEGKVDEGCAKHAPYAIIFINGAVAQVPDAILQQLAIGGRCVYVRKPDAASVGYIEVTLHSGETVYSARRYYDAAAPYLPEFLPEKRFAFS
ncbi:MAG: protein-L-isoaspartate O-methyltransferase family protein [Alphaproteobacteria bacterium]